MPPRPAVFLGVAFFPPLTPAIPAARRSPTTGAFSHCLMSRSIWPSLTRRATLVISAECGIVSKYFDRSASTTSVCPSSMARETLRTASSALRFGRYPYAASSKSASKIGSRTTPPRSAPPGRGWSEYRAVAGPRHWPSGSTPVGPAAVRSVRCAPPRGVHRASESRLHASMSANVSPSTPGAPPFARLSA